jgi:3-hydroxyacyl-CoA dehydrogenase
MGIFQLLDYVGLDVCQMILTIMNKYIKSERLKCAFFDEFLEQGVRGGQFGDGSQKDGLFQYEKGKPVGIYSPSQKDYVAIHFGNGLALCQKQLGKSPDEKLSWKTLVGDKKRDEKLKTYFEKLFKAKNTGAKLAQKYLLKSEAIAQKLIADKVAGTADDVNAVLMNGFFHLYGPLQK